MKEIMAGTKKGTKLIEDMINEVKRDLTEEEFNKAINELNQDYDDTDIDPFL
jgi:uncharacterized protein YeeX (DUF496 family)